MFFNVLWRANLEQQCGFARVVLSESTIFDFEILDSATLS